MNKEMTTTNKPSPRAKITLNGRVVFKPIFNGLIQIENALIPVRQAAQFLALDGLYGAKIEIVEGA